MLWLMLTLAMHYSDILHSADMQFSSLKAVGSIGEIDSSLMSEFQQKLSNSICLKLDFGHGSIQLLPLFLLTHSATIESADYECVVQLLMHGSNPACPQCKAESLCTSDDTASYTSIPEAALHVTLTISGVQ